MASRFIEKEMNKKEQKMAHPFNGTLIWKKFGTCLIDAVKDGNIDKVREFVKGGVNVNARDKYKRTPLIHAILKDNDKIAELLIKSGADVNARDKYKRTPLIHAILKDNDKIAELLIKSGADVNARDAYGRSVLQLANESNGRIVDLLKQNGAI